MQRFGATPAIPVLLFYWKTRPRVDRNDVTPRYINPSMTIMNAKRATPRIIVCVDDFFIPSVNAPNLDRISPKSNSLVTAMATIETLNCTVAATSRLEIGISEGFWALVGLGTRDAGPLRKPRSCSQTKTGTSMNSFRAKRMDPNRSSVHITNISE